MNVQEQISQSKQQAKDRKQDTHRRLNSIIGSFILILLTIFGTTEFNKVEEKNLAVVEEVRLVNNRFNQLTDTQHRTSEISQLMMDEGFRKCVYKDSRKLNTIGFGHLILPTDNYKCITYRQAIELLRRDYDYAASSVSYKYPWANGEVKLVLINMTYQMGQNGVSKFVKTLTNLKNKSYDEAAIELLDSRWAEQTNHRALRLAGRIMAISVQEGTNGHSR